MSDIPCPICAIKKFSVKRWMLENKDSIDIYRAICICANEHMFNVIVSMHPDGTQIITQK
jgi:protein associated with RNAse G/E